MSEKASFIRFSKEESMYYRRRPFYLAPAMIILYITLFLLLGIYFAGVFFFQTHYLPNTTVGSISCGLKSPDYVEEQNSARTSRYSLLVTDRKNTLFVLEGKEFGYKYVQLGEEQQILEKQNAFLWPAALFSPNTYTLSHSVSYDHEQLAYIIEHLGLFKEDYIEPPVDAYIELKKDGYTIVPAVDGNTPIIEQIASEITDAVSTGLDSLTLSSACYSAPAIHSSSSVILEAASTIDTYLNGIITYNIWDVYQEEFGREEIMSAIRIDKDFQITLNTAVFDDFAYKLAKAYNTYGDKREFKTSLGDTVIIGGGDYGWVVNKPKEAAEILNNVTSGTPVTREPIWSQTAREAGPNDIGNTYIEVDYTNQHLYYYKEGELVLESDFVSGGMNKGNGSPDGIFDVNYKQRNATLVGENYSSKVDYFIVFAYNVGFHDASWRKTFGGDIYLNKGSHGCINMPIKNAEALYDSVSKGTPIVAYYRTPVELTTENCRISNAFSYKAPATN